MATTELAASTVATAAEIKSPAAAAATAETTEPTAFIGAVTPGTPTPTAGSTLRWSDEMVNVMLRIRFANAGVMRQLNRAKSNDQKATVWMYFAAEATNEVGIVLTPEQLRSKCAKVKSEQTKWVQDVGLTGSRPPAGKPPSYLAILREWFSNRSGVATSIIYDSSAPDGCENGDDEENDSDDEPPNKKQKQSSENNRKAGVTLLAHEVGYGMIAIADVS